jgi:hypothetical protein
MRYLFNIYISYSQDSNLRLFDQDAYLSFDFAQKGQPTFFIKPNQGNLTCQSCRGGPKNIRSVSKIVCFYLVFSLS